MSKSLSGSSNVDLIVNNLSFQEITGTNLTASSKITSVNAEITGTLELGSISNVETTIGGKQNTLTAGDAITITGDTIAFDGTDVGSGNITTTGIITGGDLKFINSSSQVIEVETALNGKQDTIADGDLTIAKTNGLQTALDAKQLKLTNTNNGTINSTFNGGIRIDDNNTGSDVFQIISFRGGLLQNTDSTGVDFQTKGIIKAGQLHYDFDGAGNEINVKTAIDSKLSTFSAGDGLTLASGTLDFTGGDVGSATITTNGAITAGTITAPNFVCAGITSGDIFSGVGNVSCSTISTTGNITCGGTVDGVDLQTLNTSVSTNTSKLTGISYDSGDTETSFSGAVQFGNGDLTTGVNYSSFSRINVKRSGSGLPRLYLADETGDTNNVSLYTNNITTTGTANIASHINGLYLGADEPIDYTAIGYLKWYGASSSNSNINVWRFSWGQNQPNAKVEFRNLSSDNKCRIYAQSYTNLSDDRGKINETVIENATETINKLRPVLYDEYGFTDYGSDVSGERDMTTTPNSGLIAQEIYYNAPELRNMVDLNTDSSGNVITPVEVDTWNENLDYDSLNWGSKAVSVNYMYLIPYLVKTIKELNARITVLEQNV